MNYVRIIVTIHPKFIPYPPKIGGKQKYILFSSPILGDYRGNGW